jgi:hypothetical protein
MTLSAVHIEREVDVLAAMRRNPAAVSPATVARALNLPLGTVCPWCRVNAPRKGALCASVPERSRVMVRRVMKRLQRKNLIRADEFGFFRVVEA